MNKTFKNFDKIIDRYIKINLLNKAIDKEFAINKYFKEFSDIENWLSSLISDKIFRKIYEEYLLGEEIDKYFFDDEFIEEIFTSNELEKLKIEKKIIEKGEKEIISLSDFQGFNNSNNLSKNKKYKKLYKYCDEKFQEEQFFNFKTLLFYLEVKRKLKNLIKNNQPNNSIELENLLKKLENSIPKFDIKNLSPELHPKIFENNGFALFDYLIENFCSKKNQLADISFIYRKLKEEKYIHARPTDFIKWLNDIYEINLDQLKDCETDKKNKLYKSLKSNFNNNTLS